MKRGKLTAVALLFVTTAALSLLLVPLAAASRDDIRFNQHFIESALKPHDGLTAPERWRAFWSRHALGRDRIFGRTSHAADSIDLDDPQQVFAFVFERIPSFAVVYPTETYYYFEFESGPRRIGGNIRLLDASEGILHIGYFDRDDRSFVRFTALDEDDGVEVVSTDENTFGASYRDRHVRFWMESSRLQPRSDVLLKDYERLVTGVHDESGLALWLLFSELTDGFYYVLSDDTEHGDHLELLATTGQGELLIGRRSRFIFFKDKDFDRLLLVGVSSKSIRENNYYDGPFDQVPPRLQIREMLERAYPYVRERGGIDEHGNFVEMPDQRVAISPYYTYDSLGAAVSHLTHKAEDSLVPAERWSRMTYEPKRSFSLPAPDDLASANEQTPIYVTQGWPANHWGHTSHTWPEDHQRASSSAWPPNHETAVSKQADTSSALVDELEG